MNKKMEIGCAIVGALIGSFVVSKGMKKIKEEAKEFDTTIEQDAKNLVNEVFPTKDLFNFDETFGL